MWILGIFLPCFVFWLLIRREDKQKQKANLKAAQEAMKFEVPPIHGTRNSNFATDKQLRKAGIL